jgi:hypothetical protein
MELKCKSGGSVVGASVLAPTFLQKICDRGEQVDLKVPLRSLTKASSTGSKAIEGAAAVLRVYIAVAESQDEAVARSPTPTKAFVIKGVQMRMRKLCLTIKDVALNTVEHQNKTFGFGVSTNGGATPQPPLYLSIQANNRPSIKWHTKVSPVDPITGRYHFFETFEFFAEVEQTKFLMIKAKHEKKLLQLRPDVVGVVILPIRFYLTQAENDPLEEQASIYALRKGDESDSEPCDDGSEETQGTSCPEQTALGQSEEVGRMRIKLEIRRREEEEKSIAFHRTQSLEAGTDERYHRGDGQQDWLSDEIGATLVEDLVDDQ